MAPREAGTLLPSSSGAGHELHRRELTAGEKSAIGGGVGFGIVLVLAGAAGYKHIVKKK
jgi:hypothetical protein